MLNRVGLAVASCLLFTQTALAQEMAPPPFPPPGPAPEARPWLPARTARRACLRRKAGLN